MVDSDAILLSLDKYPPAMTVDQVAEALAVSKRTVSRLLINGTLKYFVINEDAEKKDKRITKAELVFFMMRNTKSSH